TGAGEPVAVDQGAFGAPAQALALVALAAAVVTTGRPKGRDGAGPDDGGDDTDGDDMPHQARTEGTERTERTDPTGRTASTEGTPTG
ncbi:hypothetical protein, partial [Streptomyces sp. 8N706]|uniref:hypothetical protein n=1 Tax=Streptomyces sp. 8N706 TaxID=3457416 RepID=UPI003FD1B819